MAVPFSWDTVTRSPTCLSHSPTCLLSKHCDPGTCPWPPGHAPSSQAQIPSWWNTVPSMSPCCLPGIIAVLCHLFPDPRSVPLLQSQLLLLYICAPHPGPGQATTLWALVHAVISPNAGLCTSGPPFFQRDTSLSHSPWLLWVLILPLLHTAGLLGASSPPCVLISKMGIVIASVLEVRQEDQ